MTEAARRKDDRNISIQIEDKDCVALELKYHKRCYSSYTSFLRHESGHKDPESLAYESRLYAKSFDIFCEKVIRDKVLKRGNIYYMKKIKDKFVKTVEQIENCSASNYRTFRLKERLIAKFPQLVFHTPKKRIKVKLYTQKTLARVVLLKATLRKQKNQ